uniref:rhamnan synthesis F family protein n=1 Tax=uncultured Thiodictyon sp. TaxID=1846217 RepID=UPI0025CD1B3C
SIRSRVVLPSLAQFFVPTLSLIHEFASYTVPVQGFSEAAFWASEMVFSAAIVRESAREECPGLRELHAVVLPQGRSLVPQPDCSQLEYEREVRRARRALRPSSLPSNAVVVLGAGSVNFRKGVDLFLSCAARVAARHPSNPFYFVWIGYGFDPIKDLDYSIYLRDQLQRAGLTGLAAFAGEFAHIDLAYELADVLFLSSRLDALPNVVIDAAHYQLPVVCFDRTTGIADMLKDNGLGDACVAPYLDIEQAAQRLVDFIDKPELRMRIGSELNTLGSRLFDMERYVASLERLALQCAAQQEIERQDCALIEDAGVLRVDFASPPMAQVTRQDATRTFVRSCASGIGMRKPFPGFHPGIYRDAHSASTEHRNPLVDFLQAGKPTGPWLCDVISPSSPYDIPKRQLRVALHIHAFYADLVPDIRSRLDDQDLDLDLLISVPSQAIADRVRLLLSRRSGRRQEIRVVPNRGRDIGPLLTEFGAEIVAKYDLIGHIHTKKTADIEDVRVGRQWFDFLLENLLGGSHPMAAKIIAILAADDGLGLVFPDDPNTVGWTDNRSIASDLAERLGIEELPGGHFWFPVGTMFWAKTKALRPLLDLRFEWEDYPEEPLPYDGTVLHAIERLLPTVAKKAGYRIALTNIPGVTR